MLPGAEPGQEGLSGLAEVAVSPCKGSLGNALKREDSGAGTEAPLRLPSMKRETCGVGDDGVASLVSRTPDRDVRRKSLFSFLRSRSTCQEASEKSGLSSPFQEKASACVGMSGRRQQSWGAKLLAEGNTC